MAHRTSKIGSPGLRAELAAKWRGSALSIAARMGSDPRRNPYYARAEALERGEPVEVQAWELPRGVLPGPLWQMPNAWRLEPDGSLVPLGERS